MKKKVVVLFSLLALMMATSVRPIGAEEIPESMLAQMGLAGMQEMSDQEGEAVRGEGFASVFGAGLATVLLASRFDNHSATSNVFNAAASGDSLSEVSTSLQVNIVGLTATLSFSASAAGQGFAFGR